LQFPRKQMTTRWLQAKRRKTVFYFGQLRILDDLLLPSIWRRSVFR
jgi:hypothetical protein